MVGAGIQYEPDMEFMAMKAVVLSAMNGQIGLTVRSHGNKTEQI